MRTIFTSASPYTKQARFIAMLWTLLIFIGCLMPSHRVPKVDMPLMDKWVHFVLFGGFTFLWLCARPAHRGTRPLFILAAGVLLGAVIELLQHALPSLGRAMELMDVVADGIGALLGVLLFVGIARSYSRP